MNRQCRLQTGLIFETAAAGTASAKGAGFSCLGSSHSIVTNLPCETSPAHLEHVGIVAKANDRKAERNDPWPRQHVRAV
jgi:hypothetical protein